MTVSHAVLSKIYPVVVYCLCLYSLRFPHLRKVSLSNHNGLRKQYLLLLSLLISGLQPDGPAIAIWYTEFQERSGLGIIHVTIRSLLPQIDMLCIWAKSTNADVIILSETWLTQSCSDKVISIKVYKVFRTDCPKRGGRVANSF